MSEDIPFADRVTVSVETLPSGHLALRHEGIVNAALEDVWKVWTTSEGLMSFAAPFVRLDFRVHGTWESSYNPEAQPGDPRNIINEVLCFLPMQMLCIRIAQTPPGFPDPEVGKKLWTVIQLQPLGEKQVSVTSTMLGWEGVDQSHPVFQLFYRGNASTMGWLQERFERGPRQWS